jgi:hypothetical protein
MSKRVVKPTPVSNGVTFARLVEQIDQTHEILRQQAVRSVNRALVVRNWLVGHYIVEFEQHGADRATYGERLLKRLSAALGASSARGFSERSLELSRRFYQAFPEISQTPSAKLTPHSGDSIVQTLSAQFRPVAEPGDEIHQTLSDESAPRISQTLSAELQPVSEQGAAIVQTLSEKLARRFPLSWSHYAFLVQIRDPRERRFYELETANENWSIRELKRQFNSSLYERLALSRDKKKVRQLSGKGQVVTAPADAIKEPVVLEFLGLKEHPAYSEKDENPTVGIVLCKTKSDAVVEMTLPKGRQTIFASRYQLYLPSKAELRAQLDGPKSVRNL